MYRKRKLFEVTKLLDGATETMLEIVSNSISNIVRKKAIS